MKTHQILSIAMASILMAGTIYPAQVAGQEEVSVFDSSKKWTEAAEVNGVEADTVAKLLNMGAKLSGGKADYKKFTTPEKNSDDYNKDKINVIQVDTSGYCFNPSDYQVNGGKFPGAGVETDYTSVANDYFIAMAAAGSQMILADSGTESESMLIGEEEASSKKRIRTNGEPVIDETTGRIKARAIRFSALSEGDLVVYALCGNSGKVVLYDAAKNVIVEDSIGKTMKKCTLKVTAPGEYYLGTNSISDGFIYFIQFTGEAGVITSSPAQETGDGNGEVDITSESEDLITEETAGTKAAEASAEGVAETGQDAAAGTVYAIPTADASGDGSSAASPMKLSDAISSAQPGQIIVIPEGSYDCTETFKITRDGTEESHISIAGDGKVVLDFSGVTDANDGVLLRGSYWDVSGIEITKSKNIGMEVEGSYNSISDCRFYFNGNTGLQISGDSGQKRVEWPHDNYVLNCTSHDNYDDDKKGEDADGFAAKIRLGYGNVFDGCVAYNNSDDGWDLYAKDRFPDGVCTIVNCVAFRNGYLSDGNTTENGDGNGFKLGSADWGVPNRIMNCLAFENMAHGFTDNNNTAPIEIRDCTAYNNNIGNSLITGKKNFQFDKEREGEASGLISVYSKDYASKQKCVDGAKGKSKDILNGTVENSVLFMNFSYLVTDSSAISSSSSGVGEKLSEDLSEEIFKSVEVPETGSDFDALWRDGDGYLKLGDLFAIDPEADKKDGSSSSVKDDTSSSVKEDTSSSVKDDTSSSVKDDTSSSVKEDTSSSAAAVSINKAEELNKKGESGYGSSVDTAAVTLNGKKAELVIAPETLASSITLAAGESITVKVTGATDFSSKTSGVKVNKKGVVKINKKFAGTAVIEYKINGEVRTLNLSVFVPVLETGGSAGLTVKNLNLTAETALDTQIRFAVKAPLNTKFDSTKIKNKGILDGLNVKLEDSVVEDGVEKGLWYVTGTVKKKGSVTLPFKINEKSYKAKIKVKIPK